MGRIMTPQSAFDTSLFVEISPDQLHQQSATRYAYKALTSGFIDNEDLEYVNSRMIKVICGEGYEQQGAGKKLTRLTHHFKALLTPARTPNVDHNCQLLAMGLDLPEHSWKVVKFITIMNANRGLYDFINKILPDENYANAMFATMLKIEEPVLLSALRGLSTTGLFSHHYDDVLIDFMDIPQPITNLLLGEKVKYYVNLIEPFIQSKPKSDLKLKHFNHLECDTLYHFLDIAINQSLTGVNILFYGAPGTGKSELAKVLADHTQSHLLAIKSIGGELVQHRYRDKKGNASANLRLQYLTLVQRLVSVNEKTLLLIDECEDVFEQSIGIEGCGKEMLHEVMESNPIPTIWITNHINAVPHSCIRRFNYVLNVVIPDNRVMEGLMDKHFTGLRVSKPFKSQLAALPDIVPAHITNAALVSHLTQLSGKAAEHNIDTMIKSTLVACGHSVSQRHYQPQLPFKTDNLNIKGGVKALAQLEQMINHDCDIRTLLLGAPGTGKTAVVKHLADISDRELITIRCSDVLGKYVGESEKNIARIFEQANDSHCILFFDEVDSLLLDRGGLNASWEIQQVNELLTQMECFNQPFFAATNFSERLDKAVMRRFDVKLSFDYLTQNQAQNLFRSVTDYDTISTAVLNSLSALKQLTPGDFAILKRRQKLSHARLSITECLAILTTENNSKPSSTPIGFVR